MSIDKEIKCEYFYYVTNFYSEIKHLCENLKPYENNDSIQNSRKKYLEINLRIFNLIMRYQRLSNRPTRYYFLN